MRPILFATLLVLAGAAACGPLVSDPDADPRGTASPVGVAEENRGLKPRKNPVVVGDVAPRWALADQNSALVTTGELTAAGDAMLVFHPGHESSGERPVYQWVRDNREKLAQRKCEILLVTTDDAVLSHAIGKREELKVAILADPSAWVARAHGFVPAGAPEPTQVWSVIIGNEGKVLAVKPGLFDYSESVTALVARPSGERKGIFD